MADVFLSYARASMNAAKRVAAELRSSGYSVWFDEHLPAHRAYSDVIEEQLDAAKAVLVLWSAEAARSHWVRSEANRALETGRIVQALVGDARLPMPFDQIQCADLRHWSGKSDEPSWRTILISVGALVGGQPLSESPASPITFLGRPNISRRGALIGGGAVAAVAVAGLAIWPGVKKSRPSPQASLLVEKGVFALQTVDPLDRPDPAATLQAVALLTDAVRSAPKSATAWGALAMAYAFRRRAVPLPERSGAEVRSRSAARTALELDPNEPRALAALRLLDPVYRNWLAAERGARAALKRNPRWPILLFILSDVLGSVGRWREAVQFSTNFDREKFLMPDSDHRQIMDLWASGDLQAADRALETAVQHWPHHPQIWRTRVGYLMYSGRPTEALRILSDDAARPRELSSEFADVMRATAEALAGHRKAADAVRRDLGYLKTDPSAALQVAQACAALGAGEEAFALFDGYYFGEGQWSALAPPAGDEDRVTKPLFQPPMTSLWRDHRFDRLLDRIGLTTYWRESETMPDYRRFG